MPDVVSEWVDVGASSPPLPPLGPWTSLNTTQSRVLQNAPHVFLEGRPLLRPRAEVGGLCLPQPRAASRMSKRRRGYDPTRGLRLGAAAGSTARLAPRGDRRVDSTPRARPPAWARGLRLLAVGAGSQGTQGVQWGGRRPSARGRALAPRLQRPGSGSRRCRSPRAGVAALAHAAALLHLRVAEGTARSVRAA